MGDGIDPYVENLRKSIARVCEARAVVRKCIDDGVKAEDELAAAEKDLKHARYELDIALGG